MVNPQMEAEQAVLGAILLAPRQLRSLSAWLRPAHFYRPAHAALFEALLAQQEAGHPGLVSDSDVDQLAWVTQAMAAASAANPGFTAAYGHALIAACPVPGHAVSYGRMVLETAVRREVHEHAHRLLNAARTGHIEAALQLTGALRTAIDRLADSWGSPDERPRPAPGPWPLELSEHIVEETRQHEQVLLGAVTAVPGELAEITSWLHPADFLDPGHRAVYRALAALGHRGDPIDPLTVLWEVQHRGTLSGGDITADGVRSITRAGFTGDPGYWAEQVLRASVLRSATTSAGAVRLLSLDASVPAARLLGSALHVLRETEAMQKRWRTATSGAEPGTCDTRPGKHRRGAARARTLAPVPDTAGAAAPSPAQQAVSPRAPVRSTQ
ncbi:DnaB-like helicase N-terminal domain-containing protein [Kitasatospora sp. NPDC057015]|uniref:DnaB-like helicase N-terminal domain-containing protein n=1 Tax=Kitasatospora sp. NPDC057015 TaxID=3346001 RepID=UPI00363A0A36